ncbi:hypothetical protein BM1374166_01921 [Bartonella tribocorum]|nr:hypothetical protein BM1374166_01921 [Bartonella tribocorum]
MGAASHVKTERSKRNIFVLPIHGLVLIFLDSCRSHFATALVKGDKSQMI